MSRVQGMVLLAGVLAVVPSAAGVGVGPVASQQAEFFFNVTADPEPVETHCTPGAPCPLRSALIQAAEVRGTVRACYDPSEVAGASGCPDGAEPLRTSDPGYDADLGKWVVQLQRNMISLELKGDGVTLDLARDVPGWDGPRDNRIAVHSSGDQFFGFAVDGNENVMTGFDIHGDFSTAAVVVRIGASDNRIGPGIVIHGITTGGGIQIRDRETTGNRVVGSWCGIKGDGTEADLLARDCVQILKGAHDNVVGGPDPQDRNVLASSPNFAAVAINDDDGFGTIDNRVEGNWLGLDASGEAGVGGGIGLRISNRAHGTHVRSNVVGGNDGDGILVTGATFGTVIEGNLVGTDVTGDEPRPNGGVGVVIRGGPKDTRVAENRIAFNVGGGVLVSSSGTRGATVTRNSITGNGGPALDVAAGANTGLRRPSLDAVTDTEVTGRACGGCTVEVFSDPGGQADTYEGTAVTDVAFGFFTLAKPDGFSFRYITTVALDDNGNTSSMSEPWPEVETPTPTPGPGEPTATPGLAHQAFLPWLSRDARR